MFPCLLIFAAGLVVVGLHGDVTDLTQAQGMGGQNLLFQTTVQALDELNIQVCHFKPLLNPQYR